MKTVTVIIPVKNEETGLRYLLKDLSSSGLTSIRVLNLIFVIDSRTSDESIKIAEMFGGKLIYQVRSTGKGNAIRLGVKEWNKNPTDIVVFLDADGSYSFDYVGKIIDSVERGFEVVSGSRFIGTSKPVGMSPLHVLGNRLLSKISGIKNKRKITDLCTGLWGFSSGALKKIEIRSNGFDLEAELVGLISRRNLSHAEIPVRWEQRKGGVSKLRSFKDGIIILIRIILT